MAHRLAPEAAAELEDIWLYVALKFEQADAALLVPRDAAVLRELSQVRREVQSGGLNVLAAAQRIVATVHDFGLQPTEQPPAPAAPLVPQDVGVVVYQVVLAPR